jgi:hypothetical protein
MYGETLIEAPEQSTASAASIFVKFTITQYYTLGICAEFLLKSHEECRKYGQKFHIRSEVKNVLRRFLQKF